MTLQDRYINPYTDFGFKKLFGSEVNKDLLIDFLNQLLPEKHHITNLSYAQNEHFSQRIDDRKAIFDLYCVGRNGDRFIVEMQKAKQNYFKDRSIYYTTFPIQEQAQKGEWNQHLFDAAEIARFDEADYEQYEASLKAYRDPKNITDTARDDGRKEVTDTIAKAMLASGEAIEKISQYTGLTTVQMQAMATDSR